MTTVLKLTSFSMLHASKPYKLLNGFSSSTAAGDSILRSGYSTGWRCRTIPCASSAHIQLSSRFSRGRKHGTDFYFHTSDSRNQEKREPLVCQVNNNFGTRMGTSVNEKVEEHYDESEMSPPKHFADKPRGDPSKILTLPTILTIGRVAAVPVLVSTFYVESWWGPAATTGVFIMAAITDWLDGYLARKMKLGTQFGAFLDPVADKLMVAATLILLCTRPIEASVFGQIPWLLAVPAIAIIGREITMSAIREWAASLDKKLLEAVAVNNLGKWKTATQMSALTILLAARDASLAGAEAGTLVSSGVVLLYISAWLSLWSLAVYMRKMWKLMLP